MSVYQANFEKVIDKFGPNLKSLGYCTLPEPSLSILTKIPNIEKLSIPVHFIEEYNHAQYNKLKSIQLIIFRDEDMDRLEGFMAYNLQITHLALDETTLSKVNIKRLLNLMSKFKNLVHLDVIQLNFDFNDISFTTELTQMSLKCRRLKSLKCRYCMDIKNSQLNKVLFSPLKQFKYLKRLVLANDGISTLFSFEAFKGFEDITHLSINLWPNNQSVVIKESTLRGIDVYLPKLQSLRLNGEFEATEWTADILCRLSALEEIQLCVKNERIESLIMSKLKQNCKRIRKIIFR